MQVVKDWLFTCACSNATVAHKRRSQILSFSSSGRIFHDLGLEAV